MPFYKFFIILSLCYFSFVVPEEAPIRQARDPAIYYTMMEMICSYGYHVQEHTIVTEDGFILHAYRIPGGKRRPEVKKKRSHYFYLHDHDKYHPDFDSCIKESMNQTPKGPPVLFMHGVIAASDCWILQGPEKDLAYMLADLDYDVWFGNIRGNFYSRRHKTLKISDKAFWDFSFHENGIYDMTSTVDHILNVTGHKKMFYIGHSMGTSMFFVMTSVKPEYNNKIALFVAITPVGLMRWDSYSSGVQEGFTFFTKYIFSSIENGIFQLFPRNAFTNYVLRTGCTLSSPRWLQNLCYDFVTLFVGMSSKLFLRKDLFLFLSHSFSGSSAKTYLHFAQELQSQRFHMFDYGSLENLRRYGQIKAPPYNYSRITVPIALYYSRGDSLSNYKDVHTLMTLLPNVVLSREYANYNHVDFLWAYNAKENVYNSILELMDKYRDD